MTKLLSHLTSRFAAFARNTDGSVNIEAILFFPFLIALMSSTIVFYDAFRKDSLAQKAAYTIGDMISRETDAIDATVVTSARELAAAMVDMHKSDVTVRVTQVTWNKNAAEYRRNWSKRSGNLVPVMQNTDVNAMADELPTLKPGERIILVDIIVDYEWPIDLGIDNFEIMNTIYTRPRFAPKLAWSNG